MKEIRTMKSIFDQETYNELNERLDKLTPETLAKWGIMNVSQMLHHAQKALEIPLGKSNMKPPNPIMKLMFRTFKGSLYSDKLWKPGLPTVKEFVVSDKKMFEPEMKQLRALIEEFHSKKDEPSLPKHPAFGKLSMNQWGKMQYKHLDHHLRQFGV